MSRKLIANRWIAPDGRILQSKHRHDFVQYGDFFVDGGLAHCRISGGLEDFCVYSDDPHEAKRGAFVWGSYGKTGREPIQWIILKDMQTEHIWNILRDQGDSLPEHIREMFVEELQFRKESKQ